MRRCALSRLLLSALLMLQLGTSVGVHASPLQGVSIAAAPHEHLRHCTTRDGLAVEHGHDVSSASHSTSKLVTPSSKTGCCTQSTCPYDCASTVAVSGATVDEACVLPDDPVVIGFAALLIEVREFEFFRPPI